MPQRIGLPAVSGVRAARNAGNTPQTTARPSNLGGRHVRLAVKTVGVVVIDGDDLGRDPALLRGTEVLHLVAHRVERARACWRWSGRLPRPNLLREHVWLAVQVIRAISVDLEHPRWNESVEGRGKILHDIPGREGLSSAPVLGGGQRSRAEGPGPGGLVYGPELVGGDVGLAVEVVGAPRGGGEDLGRDPLAVRGAEVRHQVAGPVLQGAGRAGPSIRRQRSGPPHLR
mmetsp:Transcript_34118/g.98215  ORF Transcript_34118/g.98215 Transcript_34118/m.98215 type:complete len:229 (+) Transcript_34118:3138-3824(+)